MKHDKSKSSKSKWETFNEENDLPMEEGSLSAEATEGNESSVSGELEHPDYTSLEEKLTESEQKAHENWEKVVRITAELDNVRRRAQRDVEQAHRFSLEKMITTLLPVIDSLEQAIQLFDKDAHGAMYEGLALTMKLFVDALAKQGVVQLDPIGMIMNPQEHEVMTMVDSPDAEPHSVISVFQKGYRLHDRIIRPARVVIAKG